MPYDPDTPPWADYEVYAQPPTEKRNYAAEQAQAMGMDLHDFLAAELIKREAFECPRMPGHLKLTKHACLANQDKIKNHISAPMNPLPAISYCNCRDCPTGKRVQAGKEPCKAEVIPIDPLKQKTCRSCGLDKSETEYHRNKLTKDGLQNICRACVSEKYYPAYKDRRKSKTGVSR